MDTYSKLGVRGSQRHDQDILEDVVNDHLVLDKSFGTNGVTRNNVCETNTSCVKWWPDETSEFCLRSSFLSASALFSLGIWYPWPPSCQKV